MSRVLAVFDRLEAGQTELKAGQQKLETNYQKLEAGQQKLEAGHTQLRADLMGRMDRLQDAITIIRDDVRVNFGRADAVQRVPRIWGSRHGRCINLSTGFATTCSP